MDWLELTLDVISGIACCGFGFFLAFALLGWYFRNVFD